MGTAPPLSGLFWRQIENDRQVRLQTAGGEAANLPQPFDIQSAGMALIDDVGKQKAIGEDDLTGSRAGRMISATSCARLAMNKQRLAHAVDLRPMMQHERRSCPPSECRPDRCTSSRHGRARQPIGQQPALRRFASAVQTIQGDEKWGTT